MTGKYERKDGEGIFAQPFKGETDELGQATIELPAGRTGLWADSKRYQLPVKLGRRYHRLELDGDAKVKEIKLVLQRKGLDVLGDWEDLCGFVFG